MIYNRPLLVMSPETDARAAIAKAEQAASAGDYAGAERHLGEAVALQRAAFGPIHPDLANTLNNLGVACEYVGKLDDAEQAYRQAYAIALQVFEPDHPFVTRSTDNLRDFCQARGRPFTETPPPSRVSAESSPSAVVEPATIAAPVPVSEPAAFEAVRISVPSSASRRSSSRRFFGIVVVLAAAAIVVLGWQTGELPTWVPAIGRVDGEASHAPRAAEPPLPVRSWEAGTVEPKTDTSNVDVAPPSRVQPPERNGDAGQAAGSDPDGTSDVVAEAQVCQSLSRPSGAQWLCDPVEAVANRGTLVFYTRIRSRRPDTVEHLWYLDGRLDRRAELHVGANPGSGYRTFSRNAMTTDDRAGSWRVELRARDGTLLHEQRFDVR